MICYNFKNVTTLKNFFKGYILKRSFLTFLIILYVITLKMLQLLKNFLRGIFENVLFTVLNNNICYNFKNVTTLKNFLGNIFWNVFLTVHNNIVCFSIKNVTLFKKIFFERFFVVHK